MNLTNSPIDVRLSLRMSAMAAAHTMLDVCSRRTDVPLQFRLDLLHRAARLLIGTQLRDLDDLPKVREAVALHLLYPAILSDGLHMNGKPFPPRPRSMLTADQSELAEQWFARALAIELDAVPSPYANRDEMDRLVSDFEEMCQWTPKQNNNSPH